MKDTKLLLQECKEFEWDKGNIDKNSQSHEVSIAESEQVFFNQPLLIADDEKHSLMEKRYYALGHADNKRKLFIAFTVRNKKIRVISARDMSQKERKIYEKI